MSSGPAAPQAMTRRPGGAQETTRLLVELKTRARLRLNAARRTSDGAAAASPTPQPELRLRDCLDEVARDVGFAHWEHARRVLGGMAGPGDDMGTFWHAPACLAMLSAWHSTHAEARAALAAERGRYLLPYRRQFIVADADFVVELGLRPADPRWADIRCDLAGGYGSAAWLVLAFERLKAPLSTFAPMRSRPA
jgi:hypothetical protein